VCLASRVCLMHWLTRVTTATIGIIIGIIIVTIIIIIIVACVASPSL
jgi:hypothetical protein